METRSPTKEDDIAKKSYSYNDLLKFSNPNINSSIGKLPDLPSSPTYGFGTATREQQNKIFQSKKHSTSQFIGKTSPGPNYDIVGSDRYYFKKAPKFPFGTAARNTLDIGEKYPYYRRQDTDFDPVAATLHSKWNNAQVRIGLENRFHNTRNGVPGPEYDAKDETVTKSPPKYSFGARRPMPGQDPLLPLHSTNSYVGPGSYIDHNSKVHGQSEPPKFTIGKSKKFEDVKAVQKHVTYDNRSAIGEQVDSKKKSSPKISFGKSSKDTQPFIFKDMMSNSPTRLNLRMPVF